MILILLSAMLYALAGGLLLLARRRRGPRAVRVALAHTGREFSRLLPRLLVGIIGAGFIARLLPGDAVLALLGPESGWTGVTLAAVAGALTPGGPVVGFALGGAAAKAGAGLPQLMAFVTGWSLYTLNRVLVWEVPTMPGWFVRLRVLVSLPFPFVAAALADLTGR